MGLLESLGFGKKRLAESELLQALLEARRQGDMRRLTKLCRDHVDVIIAAIPRWQKPPDEVTGNPRALNDYIQTLGIVAELLREAGLFDKAHRDFFQISLFWKKSVDPHVT